MRALEEKLGRRIDRDVPMRKLTTVGIGGPALAMAVAKSRTELTRAIRVARAESIDYLIIGGGSNLLVADDGVDLLVVKNEAAGIAQADDVLTVESGTPLQTLVDYTLERGLAGMHRLTGIPGTVGGAVYGNAGAYGQTISDHLLEVVCFDGRDTISVSAADCRFGYRFSVFKENRYAILAIRLRLPPGDAETLAAESRDVLTQRLAKYPVGLKCPGSFFKNALADRLPPGALRMIPPDRILYGKVPAGYLLEQVGAKGSRMGDIQISPTNANLFVNLGEGKAADFVELASTYARRVRDKYGVELDPEVQLINIPKLALAVPAREAEPA